MSIADIARIGAADNFSEHGETVTIDVKGVAVEALALCLSPTETAEFSGRPFNAETLVFQFLAEKVAPSGLASSIVNDGAMITRADGSCRVAQGDPRYPDNLSLIVEVDTRPAA